MIDAPDVQSIDFSIKKNLQNKSSFFEDIKFLLKEARQLAQHNNESKKIIHTIIEKFILDKKEYYDIPEDDIDYKSIAIELKFICISNNFFEVIIWILRKRLIFLKLRFGFKVEASLIINTLNFPFKPRIFLSISSNSLLNDRQSLNVGVNIMKLFI